MTRMILWPAIALVVAVAAWIPLSSLAIQDHTRDCSVTVPPAEPLQKAIDDATTGSTICLTSGEWEESITIDKSLHLKAASEAEAIVRPASHLDGAVIRVADAQDITISGLKISGLGKGQTGVLLRSVNRATLKHTRISDLEIGVDAAPVGGEKVILHENRVVGKDTGIGIRVLGDTDAELAANEVVDKAVGAMLAGTGASNVTGNTFFSNITGMVVGSPTPSRVEGNVVRRSTQAGVQINGQARPSFIENEIRANEWGFALWQRPCFDTDRTFEGTIRGSDNLVTDNVQGPLCPRDHAWPGGFLRSNAGSSILRTATP